MRLATIFLSGRTSMSQVILTVLLVLSGCSWTPAGGQICSISGKKMYSENVLQTIGTFFTGTAAINCNLFPIIYMQLLNFDSPMLP